jgi:DNA-binding FadR family transcriptional regulator
MAGECASNSKGDYYPTPVGKPGTLVQAAAGRLIRLIMEGWFKYGQKLPCERELAGMLKVGRVCRRNQMERLP